MFETPETDYMLCIPMKHREIPDVRKVFEGHEKFPPGVLEQAQTILDLARDDLPEDHPVLVHLRGLIMASGVAASTGAALHEIFKRGTFVRQPDGGAND